MPRIDWTRFLVIQLSILAAIVLLALAWTAVHAVLHTVLLFVLAAVLAFALAPLVERSEARGLPRPLAVALVYLALATILMLAIGVLGQPFVVQAALLIERMPIYVTGVQDQLFILDRLLEGVGLGGGIAALQAEAARQLTAGGTAFLGDLIRVLTHVASSVFDTILLLVVSFYLLLDAPRLRAAVLGALPAQHHSKFAFVEVSLGRVVGGYLRGQLIMAAILGVVVGVGMQAMGMPYAVVLGVLAAVLELVPILGPILSALPALAVALFQPFPTVLVVLAFFVVVQQIESNFLAPRITGHAVGLHPLGAIFALLAGLELGGLLGALFAVPVAGFLWVLVSTLYSRAVAVEEPQPARGWRLPRRPSRAPRDAATADAHPANEPERP